jgi:hypothetical protein
MSLSRNLPLTGPQQLLAINDESAVQLGAG